MSFYKRRYGDLEPGALPVNRDPGMIQPVLPAGEMTTASPEVFPETPYNMQSFMPTYPTRSYAPPMFDAQTAASFAPPGDVPMDPVQQDLTKEQYQAIEQASWDAAKAATAYVPPPEPIFDLKDVYSAPAITPERLFDHPAVQEALDLGDKATLAAQDAKDAQAVADAAVYDANEAQAKADANPAAAPEAQQKVNDAAQAQAQADAAAKSAAQAQEAAEIAAYRAQTASAGDPYSNLVYPESGSSSASAEGVVAPPPDPDSNISWLLVLLGAGAGYLMKGATGAVVGAGVGYVADKARHSVSFSVGRVSGYRRRRW